MILFFATIIAFFGFSGKTSKDDTSSSLCDEYPLMNCIEFSGVSGDYADNTYVTLHKVNNTRFTYKATSENSKFPLKNAFDTDDKKTYYAASTPNSDTYHNTITVEFNETVTLEAVLYYASFYTRGTRIFHGSPTKLKIYSSLKDEMFQLEAIFVGQLQPTWEQFQYVFSAPVKCDKIKLEFVEVTPDKHTSNGQLTPVTGGITFIQQYGENESAITNKKGNFNDANYFNSHKISTGSFTYTSTESRSDHPLSYAFDKSDKDTYWVPKNPNTDTFRNSITVTFSDVYSIEGFVYFPAYNTINKIRVFQGAPTRLNVYTSLDDKELELRQVFHGNPQRTWDYLQFVFPKPIRCNKIMLEFAKVTPDNYASNGAPHPVVGGLTFLTDTVVEKYTSTNGNFNNKIPTTDFTYTSSPSADNYPISNAFDNNDSKYYWVGKDPNTDTFNNYITVTFNSIQAINGFTYYPAFNTRANNVKEFQGTPLKLYVLGAVDENKFELKNIFVNTPENDWKMLLFSFSTPVVCKQIKLQFVEVTPDRGMLKDKLQHPSTGGISFLKTVIPDPTPVPPATPVPPSATPTRTAFPPSYSCGENNIRCDIKSENNLPTHVSVGLTNFVDLSVDQDGGAIRIINGALECENVKFEKCKSNTGGGGGVYINNEIETNTQVRLDNLNFNNCKALYGGAVYVYSSSTTVKTTIHNCKFIKNEATASKSEQLFGGGALYLHVRNGDASGNTFYKNKGGTIKVINTFENKYSMLLDNNCPTFLVSKCEFVKDIDSNSLFFYVAGNNGAKFVINDCVFSGNLLEGAHYIEGVSLSKESHKLQINKCKFSNDSKSSLNLDDCDSYLSIDLKNQIFDYDISTSDKQKEKKSSLLTLSNLAFAGSALFIVAVLILLLKNKKKTQLEEQNDDSSDDINEIIIDQSLI